MSIPQGETQPVTPGIGPGSLEQAAPVRAVTQLEYHAENSNFEPITSDSLVATLQSAGIKKEFTVLQDLLRRIRAAKPELAAYGSGEMFRELEKEFETPTSSPLSGLMGSQSNASGNIVADTRSRLRHVATAMGDIEAALLKLTQLYRRVESIIEFQGSSSPARGVREENLMAWAARKGVQLKPDAYSRGNGVNRTKSYTTASDIYGLIDMFDQLRLELETLRLIPVYFRTGSDSGSTKIRTPVREVYLLQGESIQSFAKRVTGSVDKAPLILEFNDLVYADILAEGFDGRPLLVPQTVTPDSGRLASNFVLDAQSGIKVLGRDLPNELEVVDGDLKLLDYTDTFTQSIENMLFTTEGSYPEEGEYGSRVKMMASNTPADLAGGMVEVEALRATMKNPRVSSVGNNKASLSGDKVSITMDVKAINNITEAKLKQHMEISS